MGFGSWLGELVVKIVGGKKMVALFKLYNKSKIYCLPTACRSDGRSVGPSDSHSVDRSEGHSVGRSALLLSLSLRRSLGWSQGLSLGWSLGPAFDDSRSYVKREVVGSVERTG